MFVWSASESTVVNIYTTVFNTFDALITYTQQTYYKHTGLTNVTNNQKYVLNHRLMHAQKAP
jgi:hypothetical protein